jgi:hypothetical protein
MKCYTIGGGQASEGIALTTPAWEVQCPGRIGLTRVCQEVAEKWKREPGASVREIPGGMIAVGELGRGRKLVSVPVPAGAEVADGRLLSVPAKNQPAGAVLVALRDHSGFRGGWSLSDRQGVIVLAEGECAQGDAGRMGGGPEYLAVVAEGGTATVNRSGRLYGKAATLRVRNAGGVLTVEDVAAVAETTAAVAALEVL